ncbi:MAG: hypothetical protein K1X89_02280 [Myxococcaceae bacterium]|nr:hypothetical protein [Myxococcaceae bacterium]
MVAEALLTAIVSAVPAHHYAWGTPELWVVTNDFGKEVSRHTDFGGHRAHEVAVSDDGKKFALISEDRLHLLAWSPGGEARELVSDGGLIRHPFIAPDGSVYFNHQERPVEVKHVMDWSQVWRVSWNGGPATRLSGTPGCHLGPYSWQGEHLYFLHADCRGHFRVGKLDVGSSPAVESDLTAPDAALDSFTEASAGRAVVRRDYAKLKIVVPTKRGDVEWGEVTEPVGDSHIRRTPSGEILVQGKTGLFVITAPGKAPKKLVSFQ